MRRTALLLAVVGLAAVAAPVSAGTGSGEITDSCVSELPDERPSTNEFPSETGVPWLDVCAGLLASDTSDGRVTAVTGELALDGDTALAAGAAYQVGWRIGACSQRVVVRVGTLPDRAVTAEMGTACGGAVVPCDPRQLEDLGFTCVDLADETTVPLPAGSARLDGSRVVVSVDPAALVTAELYVPGAVLVDPYALTLQSAGDETLVTDFATAEEDVVL